MKKKTTVNNPPLALNRCPLFLPQNVKCKKRSEIRDSYSPRRVFINIPYGKPYKSFEMAIVATFLCYELTPIIVKNVYEGGARICAICKSIMSCKYGFSDIWYTTKNVPFELGFMLASGRVNLIFHKNKRIAFAQLSDIQYLDPREHRKRIDVLMRELAQKIPLVIPEVKREKISREFRLRIYKAVVRLYKNPKIDNHRIPAIILESLKKMRKPKYKQVFKEIGQLKLSTRLVNKPA